MEFRKDLPKLGDVTFGAKEITEAVNAVQRAFEEFMKPAWDAAGEEGGEQVAARGVAFVVAVGAYHTMLMHGADPSLEEFMAEAVGDTAQSMLEQATEQRRTRAAAKRREGRA